MANGKPKRDLSDVVLDAKNAIELREKAIKDARARIKTNPDDTSYVANQREFIKEWTRDIRVIREVVYGK